MRLRGMCFLIPVDWYRIEPMARNCDTSETESITVFLQKLHDSKRNTEGI